MNTETEPFNHHAV